MGDSGTPPGSATTAKDSVNGTGPFDGEKDTIDTLEQTPTLQDDRDGGADGEDASKPLERTHTYVKEFWKFHMRAADDDDEQYEYGRTVHDRSYVLTVSDLETGGSHRQLFLYSLPPSGLLPTSCPSLP